MQASRPPITNGGAEAIRQSSQVSKGAAIRTPDSGRPIQEIEQRLLTVVTSAPLVLFAFDAEGIFTLSEGAGLESLGIEPGYAVGISVLDLYESEPAVLDGVRRALAGEEVAEVVTVGGTTFAVRYSPQLDESGEVFQVIGVATDITPQERAEVELRRRVAFDNLIHRTFTSFIEIAPDDSTSAKQLDAAILEGLADVGRFTEAARTYILEKSDDGNSLSTTYEWCSEGTVPTAEGLGEISTVSIPWVMEQIEAGKLVHAPAIDELEPEIALQLRQIGCVGIRSMVNLPLVTRGSVVGVVGFEWTQPSSQAGVEEEMTTGMWIT